jgi:hypothetical protein
LRVIDVSSPGSPTEVAAYDTPGYAYDVHIEGHLAYVADGEAGLRIIDVSNPSVGGEIGHYLPTDGDVRGVEVAGPYAYLASGRPGLLVVDISDPKKLKVVGRFDTPRTARSIRLDGPVAYVGDLNWLRAIDISTPSAPTEIASYKNPSYADHISVSDGIAYVAAYDAGLMIVGLQPDENAPSQHFLDASMQVSSLPAE